MSHFRVCVSLVKVCSLPLPQMPSMMPLCALCAQSVLQARVSRQPRRVLVGSLERYMEGGKGHEKVCRTAEVIWNDVRRDCQ